MLEKNNIDFLVLEAYPDIAPQVGASIGLQPNGLRILDQLGCCDELLEHAKGHTVQHSIYRGPNGEKMWEASNLSDEVIERYTFIPACTSCLLIRPSIDTGIQYRL